MTTGTRLANSRDSTARSPVKSTSAMPSTRCSSSASMREASSSGRPPVLQTIVA